MPKKLAYRVRNWKEYNKALVNRGSLTVWFDAESIAAWHKTDLTGQRGRPQLYSDLSIQCCLTLKMVFKLPLRATQGFVDSLLNLLGLPLRAPDYSLLCRRQGQLTLKNPLEINNNPIHLLIDATGLKVYGEGEWKVRQHGISKRRKWLKLYLGINESTQLIEASLLTENSVQDNEVLPELLDQINHCIGRVTGDGIYDTHKAYHAVVNKGATPCFPPRKTAIRQNPKTEAIRLRNHAVSQAQYRSLKYWKKKNNYHRRSLVETAMFRFKQILGSSVQARTTQRQACEVGIKCIILNKMTELGMPITIKC